MTLDPYVVILLCALPFLTWGLGWGFARRDEDFDPDSNWIDVICICCIFFGGGTVLVVIGAGFAVGVGLVHP